MGLLSTIGAASGRAFGLTRVGAVIRDAYFNLVTLLLPGNGTNGAQNNTFLDSSTNNFTITRNGNTTQGTFSPFSQTGWSNYFNGATTSGPLLYASYSTTNFDWFTSGQDFTLECWVFPVDLATFSYSDSTNIVPRMTGNNDQNGTSNYWSFGPIDDGRVRLHYFNGAVVQVTSTSTVTANTWNHIAFTKTSSGIRIFVNGTATTATAISGTPQSSAAYPLTIGRGNSASINGYVSNYRILKNVTPPYSGSYTVPTSPLTDISGTKILTAQANRFIDSSSVANVMTVTGSTVSVQAFSPFAPTAAYSAATVGGSGYFDETSDYLSAATNTAFNCGTGNWTIEAWVYITAESRTYPIIMGNNNGSYSAGALAFGNHNTDTGSYNNKFIITGYDSTLRFVDATTHPKNTWIHIAVVRDSATTLKMFRDGVQVASTTISSGYTFDWGKGGLLVGGGNWDGVNSSFGGNIFNLRFIKGTAVYSGNFTPPTAPVSTSGSASASAYPSTTNVNTTFAASECSLLCNFTNAGITDATAKNVLETVGNAQISTTQSKFGGSSMYFDGTGDYLKGDAFRAGLTGSGDFTIECWIYIASLPGAEQSICSTTESGGTGIIFGLAGGGNVNKIQFAIGNLSSSNPTVVDTVNFTTGSWVHVAAVRSSGTISLYKNGTSVGTPTSASGTLDRQTVTVGAWPSGSATFTGYIDDLRISKYARYTSNFTPPTAALPLQ